MTDPKPIDLFDRLLGTSILSDQIQPGWNIRLHAKHLPRNIDRWYSLRVDKNLFNEWCLSISYGRIGQRGQSKQYRWPDTAVLMTQIKSTLRKRLNATNRIGCNYQIISFER